MKPGDRERLAEIGSLAFKRGGQINRLGRAIPGYFHQPGLGGLVESENRLLADSPPPNQLSIHGFENLLRVQFAHRRIEADNCHLARGQPFGRNHHFVLRQPAVKRLIQRHRNHHQQQQRQQQGKQQHCAALAGGEQAEKASQPTGQAQVENQDQAQESRHQPQAA